MSLKIETYAGTTLSRYRTYNTANIAYIQSAQDAIAAFEYAQSHDVPFFILGGGSNVFFKNKKVKSLILKNALPQEIKYMGNDFFEVSSSMPMMSLLKEAFKLKRDCCYYLASAPCELGGAIAMNAGTGIKENKSIFDFIESVKFVRNGKIQEKAIDEISYSFRRTEFLDGNTFILSAILRLPEKEFEENPITARLQWAKENQDLSIPNCGSLCDKYNANILKFLRALYAPLPAGLSAKKLNWGRNTARNPIYFSSFLKLVKLLHFIFRKDLEFEIKIIK